jgi:hypothetical protein
MSLVSAVRDLQPRLTSSCVLSPQAQLTRTERAFLAKVAEEADRPKGDYFFLNARHH